VLSETPLYIAEGDSPWLVGYAIAHPGEGEFMLQSIDPAVAGSIVGLPSIDVVQAGTPELLPMQVTNIQPVAGGFSFHAEWPLPLTSTSGTESTVWTTGEGGCKGSSEGLAPPISARRNASCTRLILSPLGLGRRASS
jgi:hypothetical protein